MNSDFSGAKPMPVIRAGDRKDLLAPIREVFIERLVAELCNEGRPGQAPIIFEVPTDQPGLIGVIVVWDAWRAMPAPERSEVIAEAYSRFDKVISDSIHLIDPSRPAPAMPRASTAQGATRDEASSLLLLPYGVRARFEGHPTGETATLLRYEFEELGALDRGRSMSVLLPTEAMREEALQRLRDQFDGVAFEMFDLSDPAGFG